MSFFVLKNGSENYWIRQRFQILIQSKPGTNKASKILSYYHTWHRCHRFATPVTVHEHEAGSNDNMAVYLKSLVLPCLLMLTLKRTNCTENLVDLQSQTHLCELFAHVCSEIEVSSWQPKLMPACHPINIKFKLITNLNRSLLLKVTQNAVAV